MSSNLRNEDYQSVLSEISKWSAEEQFRLLRDVLSLVNPHAAVRSSQATSETTLEALRQSVIGKDYPAPRKYPADEVMGLVKMKGTLLTNLNGE
jgi:hypothetical protein